MATIGDTNSSTTKANALLGLQFLSDFGDQITAGILAICLLDITNSTTQVGLVYFITIFGYVIFTFLGGLLGDKMSKKSILFTCDMGRGILALLMIIAVNEKSIGLIYLTTFLLSMLGSLHRPVKLSTWAESIPDRYLERYNSLSELSIQASHILGPLIASFFVLQHLTGVGFAVDSLTFFVCAIVFAKIVTDNDKQTQPTHHGKRNLTLGFKIIMRHREMSRYIAYDALQMFGYGAFNATFMVLAQRDFGWSKLEYSSHLSIIALFTTIGALIGATSYAAKVSPAAKLIFCAAISGFALWAALFSSVFPLSSILIGICDGLGVVTMAVTRTKVQLIAKTSFSEAIASILASRMILIKSATLLGTAVCFVLDDLVTLEATLRFMVLPIALSFFPFFLGGSKQLAPVSILTPKSR